MAYSLSSFDVCAPGFERLRSYSEFILSAPIYTASTLNEIVKALGDDIQACMRPDHFDYDAARAVVEELRAQLTPLFERGANPFDLEDVANNTGLDECEPCYLFLYVSDSEHEYPVY